jgi:hypothetical protein
MMNLPFNFIGHCYSSDNFLWSKEYGHFSANIAEVPSVLRQMFNDSMDLGFAMRSSKTGSIVYFTLEDVFRNSDGDVIRWDFVPTAATVNAHPALRSVKVTIYND